MVAQPGLEDYVLAQLHTFGKALTQVVRSTSVTLIRVLASADPQL
jgi:hypothetical protein